uniref:Putative ovule protein n=1 Tax=Solanum chacoense TaxID=4108 RepID=A0A0V0HB57_SOLCH
MTISFNSVPQRYLKIGVVFGHEYKWKIHGQTPPYGMDILFHQQCLSCTFVEYFVARCIWIDVFPHTWTFLFSSA